jgi:hypothetical protein
MVNDKTVFLDFVPKIGNFWILALKMQDMPKFKVFSRKKGRNIKDLRQDILQERRLSC